MNHGGVKVSTKSRSLSKRVARWNCFKSHIFQLNGKAKYGDKPNKESNSNNVIFADFSRRGALAVA